MQISLVFIECNLYSSIAAFAFLRDASDNPDFLPNGFAGITLKNHTVIPPMRMDSD